MKSVSLICGMIVLCTVVKAQDKHRRDTVHRNVAPKKIHEDSTGSHSVQEYNNNIKAISADTIRDSIKK